MKVKLAVLLTAIIGFVAATIVFAEDSMQADTMENAEMMNSEMMNSEISNNMEMNAEDAMPAEEAAPEAPTTDPAAY